MKIFAVAAATFAGLAFAAPAAEQLDSRQAYTPCSGLYGSQQCCATDVLGVADLDCGSRKQALPRRSFVALNVLICLLLVYRSSQPI